MMSAMDGYVSAPEGGAPVWPGGRPVVGVLHPGAMGAAIGSALKPVASAVVWAAAGRSQATSKRAELADLVGVPDVAAVARRCDVIISICPPHAALDVAGQVAAGLAGRDGPPPLYVEANAVAPATVGRVGEMLGAGAVLVDGAVIGRPAWSSGRTMLWLAGPGAPAVAALFAGSPFTARVLDERPGAASALKVCFALQSMALPALWLTMAEAAERAGVTRALLEELLRTEGVDLAERVAQLSGRVGDRAWRWAGEMDEAAAALEQWGLPDGFSRAAADWYRGCGTPSGGV
jgi:3-hydroxyisobutyrate dehydrogenase-like beta-hydroxyacid dehydrogenase